MAMFAGNDRAMAGRPLQIANPDRAESPAAAVAGSIDVRAIPRTPAAAASDAARSRANPDRHPAADDARTGALRAAAAIAVVTSRPAAANPAPDDSRTRA